MSYCYNFATIYLLIDTLGTLILNIGKWIISFILNQINFYWFLVLRSIIYITKFEWCKLFSMYSYIHICQYIHCKLWSVIYRIYITLHSVYYIYI